MRSGSGRAGGTWRGDERAGTRPAVLFACMLAVVTGGVAVAVFLCGLALVGTFMVIEPGPRGLLTSAAVWLAFWVGLSAGLSGGLALGYRAWLRMAARPVRRAPAPPAEDERAAAVRAVESLLQKHSRRHH